MTSTAKTTVTPSDTPNATSASLLGKRTKREQTNRKTKKAKTKAEPVVEVEHARRKAMAAQAALDKAKQDLKEANRVVRKRRTDVKTMQQQLDQDQQRLVAAEGMQRNPHVTWDQACMAARIEANLPRPFVPKENDELNNGQLLFVTETDGPTHYYQVTDNDSYRQQMLRVATYSVSQGFHAVSDTASTLHTKQDGTYGTMRPSMSGGWTLTAYTGDAAPWWV